MSRLSPGGILRAFLARRGTIEAPLGPDWRDALALVADTRRRVPLLMTDAVALQILICARAAARLGGAMAEAGVFMGGSARLICEEKGGAPLHLFDVFEMLQGPAESSAGDDIRNHFGATCGDRATVERLLAPYPAVHIHPGIFPATAAGLGDLRFSFVHLDLDLLGATADALAFFHPRMVAGGILIGDDYQDAGVRDVFGRFYAGRPDTVIELPWGQVMVVSQPPDAGNS